MWDKETIVTLVIGLGFFLFACNIMAKRNFEILSQPDNVIEEILEEVIEYETGLDIDLSPMSEE